MLNLLKVGMYRQARTSRLLLISSNNLLVNPRKAHEIKQKETLTKFHTIINNSWTKRNQYLINVLKPEENLLPGTLNFLKKARLWPTFSRPFKSR